MDFFNIIKIAVSAHGDQRRKYTNEFYTIHLLNVAYQVFDYCDQKGLSSFTQAVTVSAAILHDVLEDTQLDLDTLKLKLSECHGETFSNIVGGIVLECTDVYTKEAYPNHNRAKRKALEAARLRNISYEAAIIKLFDYQDNIASIKEHDPKFAELYEKEKDAYLSFLIEKYGL